ncbi:MAG: hypothetical protein ACI3UZ_04250 [Oscillospiraceae bacterium]
MSEVFNISAREASHACIIATPDEEQRRAAAWRLAAAFVCERGGEEPCLKCAQCRLAQQKLNPDIIEISRKTDDKGKQKRELSVEQIRAMVSDAWVRPQSAERKVYIIADAGSMNSAAQNAALKLLEEPPAYARFILCAESAESLLATIRSRCVIFRPLGEKEPTESEAAREYLSLVAKGDKTGVCAFFARAESMDGEALAGFLEGLRAELCAVLSNKNSNSAITRETAVRLLDMGRRAEDYMRLNVGVKHILGMLCVRSV